MAQDEGNILFTAEIRKPVPGEDALYSNDDVLPVWCDGFQEDVGICFDIPVQENFPFLVENAKVHGPGVQIDAAGKFVLLGVKSHTRPPYKEFFGSRIIPVSGMVQGGLNEYQVHPADPE